MECIVLAGGLGTRLSSVVNDVPKCMANVAGKPFLEHVLNYLEQQGAYHVILSLGYKHEVVIDWLKSKAFTCKVSWVIEHEPLGTGGGIKLALSKCKEQAVFILNGDTFYDVDLQIMNLSLPNEATALLALKPLSHFDRYGTVKLNSNNIITSFVEKQPQIEGLINGGLYLINRTQIDFNAYPPKFSWEKDFLEKEILNQSLYGSVFDNTFIDIGIPEDYERAQSLLQ